ncbi:hypothetical protein [Agromyces sp. NPDC058110]|uniref:hypothetical protein n=1 Tax=Agromyces sp. NPDC058110 TaxID=3346345 RepID=UPI0036D9A63D
MTTPDHTSAGHTESSEIVNPEDLPSQIEVTESNGVTRIDIADDSETRSGDPERAD